MDDKKNKTRSKKKDKVELNPEVSAASANLRIESLSRIGRIRLARAMKRSNKSGKLARGKRKKEARSMTVSRASELGWRSARRDLKKTLSHKKISDMSATEKSRVEKMANQRSERQKVIAKIKKRALLSQSYSPINNAFELMLEGKRYHQLFNKNGGVKIDKRFKQFRNKKEVRVTEQQIVDLTRMALSEKMDLKKTEERFDETN